MSVQAFEDGVPTGNDIRIAYRDTGPTEAPVILALHGSPGRKEHFDGLTRALSSSFRVLAPDLAGFGESSRDPPDHSLSAQASAMLGLLAELGVDRAHVVGFSLGGGIALRMWEQAPETVASITMLSSIGVQELELLGDYYLNRSLHTLQLGLTWVMLEGVPHFGCWDRHAARGHALIFHQSDQRPLRGLLERYDAPMLIIHGEADFLVPIEAAREHARLVPQSVLVETDVGHFMVFQQPELLSAAITSFVDDVTHGVALTRTGASPERVARAAEAFDPGELPPFSGPVLALILFLIAAATLISEDLACIGAGLLAAQGRLSFLAATGASMGGIFFGDMLLFLCGRIVGRAALRRIPFRWLLRPDTVKAAETWFEKRGLAVVFICRLMPGWRLPTYFAAGVVGTGIVRFAICFLIAAALWTPLLVGVSMAAGDAAQQNLDVIGRYGFVGLVVVFVTIFGVIKLGIPMLSHAGRRGLRGRWLRLTRWEFWPPWIFYPPVVAWVLWLGLRYRSLTLMTAANPGIETGGFLGESKAAILEGLSGAGDRVAAAVRIDAALSADERKELATAFMAHRGLDFPVVIKPDVGERGNGVVIVRSTAELTADLAERTHDFLVQEHVPGLEFGVFYARRPDEARGRIISVTIKAMPTVVGDGRRTLEALILDDPRAIAMLRVYLGAQADRLADVPAVGEEVQLVEIGTHCRGAIFLDGADLVTEELTDAIEDISRHFDGFFFGRYDVRAPGTEAFRSGGDFKVIELNGLTSESTHIYDPRHGLIAAWRVLFRQWSLAFEIAAANRARGAVPTKLSALLRALFDFARPTHSDP